MRGQSRGCQRSVDRGTGRPGIELRNNRIQGADAVSRRRKATRAGALARVRDGPCAVRDPAHVWKLHAREPGDPVGARHDGGTGGRRRMSRKTNMHAGEESDGGVVPMKRSNKEGQPTAESLEGRPATKENIEQPHTRPTQSDQRCPRGWRVCEEAARKGEQGRFTALLHHLTIDLLRESFYALKRNAAAGVDGVTWKEYETEWRTGYGTFTSGCIGGVSSATLQAGVHPESGRAAAPVGRGGAGGQNRPACRDGPQSDLRRGLSGILLWIPAWAKPASSAGCAVGGDRAEEGELDARCRHSWLFRSRFTLAP